MNKTMLGGLLLAVSTAAAATTFDDAVKACEGQYQKIENVSNDGAATFQEDDRINVKLFRLGREVICSVGKTSGEIEQVKVGTTLLGKEELRQAAAKNKAAREERDRIANGDHAEFVQRAKRSVSDQFKDPDSAKFRDLYLANKGLPTLCGEVNAKNSYGAYVGYRGFFYNSVSSYIDDGKELGSGFLYRKLQPSSCKDKFTDIEP